MFVLNAGHRMIFYNMVKKCDTMSVIIDGQIDRWKAKVSGELNYKIIDSCIVFNLIRAEMCQFLSRTTDIFSQNDGLIP